jgi:hypothetical protein
LLDMSGKRRHDALEFAPASPLSFCWEMRPSPVWRSRVRGS